MVQPHPLSPKASPSFSQPCLLPREEEEGKLERGTWEKEFGMVKANADELPYFGLHPLSPYLSLSFSRPCLLPRGEEEGKLEREGWEKEFG
jgi:hypothetical protein